MEIMFGLFGATTAGFVFMLVNVADARSAPGSNLWSLLVATGGAVTFILIVRALRKRPDRRGVLELW